MGFDPCNRTPKIRESFRDSNSQHGSSLVSVRVHSLTLFALPRACEVTPRSPSWPATLQPLALVTNPKLGLRHMYHYNWFQTFFTTKTCPFYESTCSLDELDGKPNHTKRIVKQMIHIFNHLTKKLCSMVWNV
jgi:hypothetical protein